MLTGYEATNPGPSGSTPPSLRARLTDTAFRGLNAFIDLELAERLGTVPNTQADVRTQGEDPSDPQRPGISNQNLLLIAAAVIAGVLILRRA